MSFNEYKASVDKKLASSMSYEEKIGYLTEQYDYLNSIRSTYRDERIVPRNPDVRNERRYYYHCFVYVIDSLTKLQNGVYLKDMMDNKKECTYRAAFELVLFAINVFLTNYNYHRMNEDSFRAFLTFFTLVMAINTGISFKKYGTLSLEYKDSIEEYKKILCKEIDLSSKKIKD